MSNFEDHLRIMLVEDDYLVGIWLQQTLTAMGHEVVGPFASLKTAIPKARSERLNGAILDINIFDGTSEPIAKELQSRGCPFFFITGYGSPPLLRDRFPGCTKLQKPVDNSELAKTIHLMFDAA
ncbi:MAG: response regulator [Planctomycetota bacterium]